MAVNSLAPGKFQWNFKLVIFKLILLIDDLGIYCETALEWMSKNLTDDKFNIGSGNEPMLTKIFAAIWRH